VADFLTVAYLSGIGLFCDRNASAAERYEQTAKASQIETSCEIRASRLTVVFGKSSGVLPVSGDGFSDTGTFIGEHQNTVRLVGQG